MELETELRRALRSREVTAPTADPVPAVHAGMRRRRRRQRVQVLGSALGVVAVAFAAFAVVDRGPGSSAPRPAGTPQADVPTGFGATDVSFVDADRGWAIGQAFCGTQRCVIQLVTSDGGRTWVRRTAQGLPSTCGSTSCAWQIRFATDRIGYAFRGQIAGVAGLWVTTDAGRTWSLSGATEVVDLAVGNGTAVRLVPTAPGCSPACTYLVQTSEVGSLVWRTVHTSTGQRTGAVVAARGNRFLTAVLDHPQGDLADARSDVGRLKDGGWVGQVDPCSPRLDAGPESDTIRVALGPEGVAAVVCQPRAGGLVAPGTASASGLPPSDLRVSTDGGQTWSPLRPVGSSVGRIAAPGPARFVVEVFTPSQLRLLLTDDAGRTWKAVASTDASDVGELADSLAFTSALDGTWLPANGHELWRTSDGGSTWTAYPFVG